MRTGLLRVVLAAAVAGAALLAAQPANAAFPGENGRVAFVSSGQIWTVNGDESDPEQVTSPTSPAFDADPSWSPDGTRIAFSRGTSSSRDLYIVNANGSGATLLTTNGQDPTWSPDGTEIAFIASPNFEPKLYRINVDGTNRRLEAYLDETPYVCCLIEPTWSPGGDPIAFGYVWTEPVCDPFDFGGECDPVSDNYVGVRPPGFVPAYHYNTITSGSDPDWAPTAAEIAHETEEIRFDYYTWSGTDGDIAAVTADGSSSRTIVSGAEIDRDPAWSPDGSSIVFQRSGAGLWVVPAAGGTPVQILNQGTQPDWQPVQRPHVRPKGATPVRVPLVPAYAQCTAPNRTHGPPLAFPACNPPAPGSSLLTIGVGDGSPAFARGSGFVRMEVLVGAPGPPDDSDVNIRFNLTNVMRASDLSEYTGGLRTEVTVRRTDREVVGGASTSNDFAFEFSALCTGTSSTLDASTCNAFTSANAIVPGVITDGRRTIWALDKVRVYDGGPDENADTEAGNALFMTQGVFVP